MRKRLLFRSLTCSALKNKRILGLSTVVLALCSGFTVRPSFADVNPNTGYLTYSSANTVSSHENNRRFNHQVKGKVTDSKGEGLPGASVVVKGTSIGVMTDVNGNYTISAPEETNTLVFSYLGFITQEVPIGSRVTVNISLAEDARNLDEVVVVGFGEQRKISLVGAQSTVSVLELDQPVANISTMLAGRIAGVTGVQRSGQPGYDGADIWIRGMGTFASAGTSPLILVDGVERSMNNIDPQDIESFTILKDASATAVYGVRGANGVVLIVTKRGVEGKPRVTFDYGQGITRFTKVPEMADGVTYMTLANEANTTRGLTPLYSQERIDKTASKEDPYVYPDVNWMDHVFKDWGKNRQANMNVSGGSPNARYYVSVGYYDETGLFNTDALADYDTDTRYKRFNVTTNLTLDLTPSTKVDLGIQGYLSNGNYAGAKVINQDGSWSTPAGAIFSQTMLATPIAYPVMYPGGFVPGLNPNGDQRNPYADVTKRGYLNESRNQLYSNLRVSQNLSSLTEGLSVNAMFAFDAYNRHMISREKREDTWYVNQNTPRNPDGTLNLGTLPTYAGQNFLGYDRSNGGNRRIYTEASINYDRGFERHHFGGLLLFNRQDNQNAFAGDLIGAIPERNQGLAGRATYSYDDRYFAEFNMGYNGSENFAPEKRYGFFPAFGVGWVISNEKFFEPLKNKVNLLKIRYTDGKVGSSSGAGRFLYIGDINSGAAGYTYGLNRQGISGIVESRYAVDVTWVEARKQDLGIEINAFDNSLSVIFDLFKEYTTGAFLPRGSVPNFIGLANDPSGNLGIVENKGFDGSVNYDKNIGNYVFGFRGTFSYNRNKVIENDVPEQPYGWLDRRGAPVLARWGYVAEKLFDSEEEIANSPVQNFSERVMPGDIKYVDLNGDGRIDANDRQQIGQGDVPALTYGFGISLGHRGFDISAFFQGQAEADIILNGTGFIPFNGDGGVGNLYAVATDRWTEENPSQNVTFPRLSYGSAGVGQSNNTQPSTWWLRDIDFLRLKTAELGYTVPQGISDKIRASNIRFYMRGVNLLTFSKFKHWDPELLTSNGAAYPNISVYSLGVNLQF